VADALDVAHHHGLVHRDLKPGNILVEMERGKSYAHFPGGVSPLYLTDFGLAMDVNRTALTQTGTIMGTPAYMPPEQLRGERVDKRADVYALACIVYESLTGILPYTGTLQQIAYGHMLGPIPRLLDPSLRALDPVIQKGLANSGSSVMSRAAS
jgi:serine/threonine protein kinase